jgi:L-2,4-diaminobutyrate decarboxylase
MALAQCLCDFVANDMRLALYAQAQTGIVVWRPKDDRLFDRMLNQLPVGSTSTTTVSGGKWLRNVAANPNADIDLLIETIESVLSKDA